METAEVRLREGWTAQGVPPEKQDAILADVALKASPAYLSQVFKPEHVCTPDTCPEPGSYYVSAKDGPCWWRMAGPYPTHQEALREVARVRDITVERDRSGRAWFMGWGTVRMPAAFREPGNLNKAGLI